jgi:hypothetical protein
MENVNGKEQIPIVAQCENFSLGSSPTAPAAKKILVTLGLTGYKLYFVITEVYSGN